MKINRLHILLSTIIFPLILLLTFAYTEICYATIISTELRNKKILIMTPIANQAEFIEIQQKTLDKFLKDDYEYIVFNDAFDDKEERKITATCAELGITCIRVPQENRGTPSWMLEEFPEFVQKYPWWSLAAFRHDQAIAYMMETVGFQYNGIVALLDSDLFLTKKFSIIDFLKNYDIAGIRLGYEPDRLHFWPGLMFFRMDKLPNKKSMLFTPVMTKTLTLNTGGSLYKYLEAYPTISKLFFKQKGRLLINQDLSSYFVLAAGTYEQIQCQSCHGTDTQCCHLSDILKEFGFRQQILELIKQQKFPGSCEFVLDDIFFHFRGISNAPTFTHYDARISKNELNEKFSKFYLFIDAILNDSTNN